MKKEQSNYVTRHPLLWRGLGRLRLRRFLLLRLCALTIIASLASCDIENSHNGDLDGLWLLTNVDTLSTGSRTEVTEQSITWAFQGHLLEMRTLDDNRFDFICKFEHSGDSLFLGQPYVSEQGHNDIPVEEVTDSLRHIGLQHLHERYAILTLNSHRMVLRSKELSLNFQKY